MQVALTLRTRKVKLLSTEVNKFSQARAYGVHIACLAVVFFQRFSTLARKPLTAVMDGRNVPHADAFGHLQSANPPE
jgi:hypothetical protein